MTRRRVQSVVSLKRPKQAATPWNEAAHGAVLLEVLLALALFVSAAAVMVSALNAALGSLERQRVGLHAMNLASSVLAEVQLGIRPAVSETAKPMEPPYQDWTVELVVTPLSSLDSGGVDQQKVEVVVRHLDPPVVQRLGQVLPPPRTSGTSSSFQSNPGLEVSH